MSILLFYGLENDMMTLQKLAHFKTEWLTTEMHILRTAGRMLVSYSTDTKKEGGGGGSL